MLRPERKTSLKEFTYKHSGITAVLMSVLFLYGLGLSVYQGFAAVCAYGVSWAVSYVILFAGACRHCPYYGKKCPIPLEGSCVHRFFERSPEPFGWRALFWATIAYGLRIAVPVFVFLQNRLMMNALVYFLVLSIFWVVHLRIAGCPNCTNHRCPLNPGCPDA